MIYQNKANRININLLKIATHETSLVVLFLHNIQKLNAKENVQTNLRIHQ